MGEGKWKKTAVGPPAGTENQRWFFSEQNLLARIKPKNERDHDTYRVDFDVTTGDNNRWWEMNSIVDQTVIYQDRSSTASRLLTYTSYPLAGDMEITGHPIITLYVTSTHTDGAIYAYLEDVHQDGRVTYITEGLLRFIHRKISNEASPFRLNIPYHTFNESDSMPLVPGETAEITFALLPTSVLIRKGHAIRVSIA